MASADLEYRCFVGGLAWATTDEALQEAFSHFGEIVESKVRLLSSDLTSTRLCRSRISDLPSYPPICFCY
ncbi:unnamed protein product [Linum tenue]|uniref:RRM domain-containing protein n=1 Tax=Linum tenue TaxID=586396 RepID=A0AAV0GWP7_9ROSI|nr:unnamed protein product [Linum tenue]